MDAQIHMLFEGLPVSDEKLEKFKRETCNDTILQRLKELTLNEWPSNKDKIPPELSPYYSVRSEITVANDILFKGEPIFVPMTMPKDMREHIYEGHLSQEKGQRLEPDKLSSGQA